MAGAASGRQDVLPWPGTGHPRPRGRAHRESERSGAADDADPGCRVGAARASWLLSGDCLVLADVVTARGPQDAWVGLRRGHRLIPIPPLGSALVTWSADAAVDAWLRLSDPDDLESAR